MVSGAVYLVILEVLAVAFALSLFCMDAETGKVRIVCI